MSWWVRLLAIGLGGAMGANARYWLSLWVASWAGTRFPWATLSVNLMGAAALGFLATWAAGVRAAPSAVEATTLLAGVGFLGGFTTFSTFSLEAFRLFQEGQAARGIVYLLASGSGGLLAVGLGAALAVGLGGGPRG